MGNTIFQRWKGKQVARLRPPSIANPNTPQQQGHRRNWATLNAAWHTFPPEVKQEWANLAQEYSDSQSGQNSQLVGAAGDSRFLPAGMASDASNRGIQTGQNLFMGVNAGRAPVEDLGEGLLGSGEAELDPNEVVGWTPGEPMPVFTAPISQDPNDWLRQPPAPGVNSPATWNAGNGSVDIDLQGPPEWNVNEAFFPVGSPYLLDGELGVVETRIRTGDPRMNRLASLAVSPNVQALFEAGYWSNRGELQDFLDSQGMIFHIFARSRSLAGRVSPWIFAGEVTIPIPEPNGNGNGNGG